MHEIDLTRSPQNCKTAVAYTTVESYCAVNAVGVKTEGLCCGSQYTKRDAAGYRRRTASTVEESIALQAFTLRDSYGLFAALFAFNLRNYHVTS